MAQFARPSVDTYNADGWAEDDGTSDALWGEIDEVTPDDADFVRSALTPTSDVYVTKLTTVEDPLSSANHTARWRYGKDVAGGDAIDLTVQLRQGYVNEGTPGTLIATLGTHTNIASGGNAGTYTLSAGEADASPNHGDLYIR